MSEHMSLEGKVDFWHLPYDWNGGMAYCRRCKEVCEKLIIDLDEGYRFIVRCSKCKKAIWLRHSVDDVEKEVVFPRDDKRCVCKKSTNEYDCDCVSSCSIGKSNYICGKRCYKIWQKRKNT